MKKKKKVKNKYLYYKIKKYKISLLKNIKNIYFISICF